MKVCFNINFISNEYYLDMNSLVSKYTGTYFMVLILKHRLQFDFKADDSNKFKQKIVSFKYRSFLFFFCFN